MYLQIPRGIPTSLAIVKILTVPVLLIFKAGLSIAGSYYCEQAALSSATATACTCNRGHIRLTLLLQQASSFLHLLIYRYL